MVGPPPPIDTNVQTSSDPSTSPSTAGGIPKRARPAPAKTFQCRGYGDCRMVFSRSEHLARHIRKHTGERPFSCHCSKQFSRLDNLRQHAHTVHADKQELNERMMRELTSLHTAHKLAGTVKGARTRNKSQQQESDPSASLLPASNTIKQEDGTGLAPTSLRPGTSTGYEGSDYYPHSYPSHSFRDSQSSQSFLASPTTPLPGSGSPPSSYITRGGEGNHSFLAYPQHPSNPPTVHIPSAAPTPSSHHYPQQHLQRIPEQDRHSFLDRDVSSAPRYFPEQPQQQQQQQRPNGIDQRTLPPLSSIVSAYPPPPPPPASSAARPITANADSAYRPGTAPASYHSQHMVHSHYPTNGYELDYPTYTVQPPYGFNSGIASNHGESPFSYNAPSVTTRTGSSPVGLGHYPSNTNGSESSPFNYGPGLITGGGDERPTSRRLSLMDICDEPGGRPNTAGGVIGASRPGTATLATVSEGSREFARFAAAAVREQRSSPSRIRDGSLSTSTGSPDIDDGERGTRETKDRIGSGRDLFTSTTRRDDESEPPLTHFSRSSPLSPVGLADPTSERRFPSSSPAITSPSISAALQSPTSTMEVSQRGSDGSLRSVVLSHHTSASSSPVLGQFHGQPSTSTLSSSSEQLSLQFGNDASTTRSIDANPNRSTTTTSTSFTSSLHTSTNLHLTSPPDRPRTGSSGISSAVHGRGGVLSSPPTVSSAVTSDGDVLLAVGGRARYTSVQSAVH